MLGIGGAFFVQIPNGQKQRILHPAKAIGFVDDLYTARLEEPDVAIVAGQELFIYYEADRDFLQQAAQILAVFRDTLKPTFELKTTGEPASAESRQFFRVSTVTSGLTADFDGEEQCPLLDVSCTGFSVISSRQHAVGSIVEAVLGYHGEEYTGKVSVQSIRELRKGLIRYGVHCAESKTSAGNMPNGLQLMTLALQSEQLRRLAGTA